MMRNGTGGSSSTTEKGAAGSSSGAVSSRRRRPEARMGVRGAGGGAQGEAGRVGGSESKAEAENADLDETTKVFYSKLKAELDGRRQGCRRRTAALTAAAAAAVLAADTGRHSGAVVAASPPPPTDAAGPGAAVGRAAVKARRSSRRIRRGCDAAPTTDNDDGVCERRIRTVSRHRK